MSNLTPLADLQFEVPPTPAPEIGKRGQLKWLPLAMLMIDETYQRPIEQSGKRNIRRIVEEFHWSKFAPLVVSPRPGGRYAIIDGQHHAVAAKIHGAILELPCWVLQCTPEEEARAFTTINGIITRVHSQHLFKARIAAQDADAVAADSAAREAGVTILPYPVQANQLKAGETLAGKTIEMAIKRFGREVVVTAMELIVKTGDGNPGYIRHTLIEGFCDCLDVHPVWARAKERARAAVGKIGIPVIYSKAVLDAATSPGQGVRANIANRLTVILRDALGDGGKTDKLTKNVEARFEAKRQHVAKTKTAKVAPPQAKSGSNLGALTKTDTRRPNMRIEKPKDRVHQDERALIDAHLQTKGARVMDSGATGNTSNMLDWLCTKGHVARRRSSKGSRGKLYEINGKNYDLNGLFDFTNKVRKKHGLQPLTIGLPNIGGKKALGGLIS